MPSFVEYDWQLLHARKARALLNSNTQCILEVAELGFTIVVGVLIDTFVVRPLLVPAITTMLDDGTGCGLIAAS
jgi:MMPL family protein